MFVQDSIKKRSSGLFVAKVSAGHVPSNKIWNDTILVGVRLMYCDIFMYIAGDWRRNTWLSLSRSDSLFSVLPLMPVSYTTSHWVEAVQSRAFSSFSALIELRQRFSMSSKLDVKSILPSDTCVCCTIQKFATMKRTSLSDDGVKRMFRLAGGNTCNGVKIGETGAKYDDFVVHHIQCEKPRGFITAQKWPFQQRLLFL